MVTHNFHQNAVKYSFSHSTDLTISCQNKPSSFKALRRVPLSLQDQWASELHYYTSGAFARSGSCQSEAVFPSGRMTQHWIAGTMPLSTATSVFATVTAIPWKKCHSLTLPNPTRSTILAVQLMSGSMTPPWATILSRKVSSTFANCPQSCI
jgi:hypothetical protein